MAVLVSPYPHHSLADPSHNHSPAAEHFPTRLSYRKRKAGPKEKRRKRLLKSPTM
jgi:hypothetical protein